MILLLLSGTLWSTEASLQTLMPSRRYFVLGEVNRLVRNCLVSRKTCFLQAKFFDTFDGHKACACHVHQKMVKSCRQARYSGYCLVFKRVLSIIRCMKKDILYSGPSLSGHSKQRPPSLIRPQIFGATTTNVFTSPFHQRPPLTLPQFLGREGLLYIILKITTKSYVFYKHFFLTALRYLIVISSCHT